MYIWRVEVSPTYDLDKWNHLKSFSSLENAHEFITKEMNYFNEEIITTDYAEFANSGEELYYYEVEDNDGWCQVYKIHKELVDAPNRTD